jgi:hypothetical protein
MPSLRPPEYPEGGAKPGMSVREIWNFNRID